MIKKQAAGAILAVLVLIAVFFIPAGGLLPLDTVPLLTYGTGYYSITDMVKISLPAVLILCVMMSLWLADIRILIQLKKRWINCCKLR